MESGSAPRGIPAADAANSAAALKFDTLLHRWLPSRLTFVFHQIIHRKLILISPRGTFNTLSRRFASSRFPLSFSPPPIERPASYSLIQKCDNNVFNKIFYCIFKTHTRTHTFQLLVIPALLSIITLYT